MAILLSDSYKIINWDLDTKSLDTKYWGKVTDSGRGCKVALLQNGVLKTPSTETMRVNFKKPSGLQIFIDGVISGNYFVFDFTEQVFAEQGEVMAELMLNVGGEWLMSSTFYIQVDQSFTSAIESSEELTALQTALTNVDNLKTQILDVNGNEILKFGATPNAVNEVTIYNNTSNQSPAIAASGDAANIGLSLATKGNGAITSFIGNSIGLLVRTVAYSLNTVNYLLIASNTTGEPVIMAANGTDDNIDLNIFAKGTGGVLLGSVKFTEATTLANVVSGESNTTLWGKVKKMFSFIGTTTLTTTAQTITTAINELVGINTYTVGSPTYVADVNALLMVINKASKQKNCSFALTINQNLSTGAAIFTLPIGFRPTVNELTVCNIKNNATYQCAYIDVLTNGNVSCSVALSSGNQLFAKSTFV